MDGPCRLGIQLSVVIWVLLLSSGGVGADDETLHRSVQFRSAVDILHHLEVAGVDVNSFDERGWTALHAAAGRDGHIQQLLIDHGANVELRTRDGFEHTALHLAVQFGTDSQDDLDRIESLMEGGADPNALSASGETAMHFAARRGDLLIALALLEHGADPNVREKQYGRTPLHEAHIHDHTEWATEMRACTPALRRACASLFGVSHDKAATLNARWARAAPPTTVSTGRIDSTVVDDAGHSPDDYVAIRRRHGRGTPARRNQKKRVRDRSLLGRAQRTRYARQPDREDPSRVRQTGGLLDWLSHMQLPHLSETLHQLGVEVPYDIRFLDEKDLTGAGVPIAQARRLMHSARVDL